MAPTLIVTSRLDEQADLIGIRMQASCSLTVEADVIMEVESTLTKQVGAEKKKRLLQDLTA
jgi:hypothetical protein